VQIVDSIADCLSTMNIAAAGNMPTVTVSMHDVSGTEEITTKQRMMSSCSGAILTSFFSKFTFRHQSYNHCLKLFMLFIILDILKVYLLKN